MNLPIKEVESFYFDKDVIRESGTSLRRLDYGGVRNYFTVTDFNTVDSIYTSVTTFAKSVMPSNPFLLDWMKNKSKEEQEFILKSSSTYGTLMDIFCNELLINREVKDFDKRVMEFTLREGLYSIDHDKWTAQLKKDVLSFATFVQDYDVKPLLISCPLKSDNLNLAGTLDLCCSMNSKIPTKTDIKNKVQPVRINTIIDYKAKIGDFTLKSDRNSFYDSECLQLHIYGMLVLENFPDIKIDALMNFSPKNWRTNPSYNLKDWTGSNALGKMQKKFEYFFAIYNIDNDSFEREFNIVKDVISLDSDLSEAMETVSLTDFINGNLAKEMQQ